MKLSVQNLRDIAWGAAYVREEDGGVTFHRFTKAQEDLYERTNPEFYKKCMAPAGVRLVFRTDSRTLRLTVSTSAGSLRRYYSFDVFADGSLVGSLDNFSGVELAPDYTTAELPWGTASREFALGEGEKTVMVYLPWAPRVVLEAFELDDGAFVQPVKREKKVLIFGDSITQGYDALRSFNRYAARIADGLGAEEYNKAIGGEVFFPALAALKEDFVPDYITVAYGTNDWGTKTWDEFAKNCAEFYAVLSRTYPDAKIFALTPIWRKDHIEVRQCCDFAQIGAYIRQVTKDLPNVTVVEGYDLVPKEEAYFADLRLHPNDAGFDHYYQNLMPNLL